MQHPKFLREKSNGFSKTLRKKVKTYFKTNELNKHANNSMISKTILMLTLFCLPFLILNLGIVTSTWTLFLLYTISGIGMAGIGMAVAHDAIHGSYSKNSKINTLRIYFFRKFWSYLCSFVGGCDYCNYQCFFLLRVFTMVKKRRTVLQHCNNGKNRKGRGSCRMQYSVPETYRLFGQWLWLV